MRWPDAARRSRTFRRAVFFAFALAIAAGALPAHSKGDAARGAKRAETCGACHGTPQRPPLPGTPWLAGQPADYVVLQMFLLREGLREIPQMAGMLKDFADRDLEDVGAYYATQSPPRPGAGRVAELHARGAALAQAMGCGSCHRADYRGQQQMPRLANQREDYLAAAMKAYRDNKRVGPDTNMNGIMYRVPDDDIRALAHFLAHQ